MSHVDDGALHAYLDGALDHLPRATAEEIRGHLATCEACAQRLEEERALRQEAHDLLAGAAPELGPLPPLEELQALARRRAASGAGERLSRFRTMGWAASVVLAAGMGWMLRGAQRPMAPVLPESTEAERGVAPSAASEAPPEKTATVAASESETLADGAMSAEDAVARAPAAEPARERVVASLPAAQGVVAPAAQGGAVHSPQASLTGRGSALGALEDSLLARMVEPSVAAKSAEGGVFPMTGTDVSARGDLSVDAASAVRGDLRGAPIPLVGNAAEVRPMTEWRGGAEAAPAAADALAALVPLTVRGLRILSVSWDPPGLPHGTVRVLQDLDGDTVEVLQLPEGVRPAELEWHQEDGRTRVSRFHDGRWVVARASASRERLEALLARLGGDW